MAATMVSSAGGLLAMLNEPHPSLKFHALSNLNAHVDLFWPEISTSVPIIESLYEDEGFDQKQRQLAALVVSKCFYFLGEHNDSLSYALGAGSLFDVSEDSDYVHTLLAKAIDEYASLRTKAAESKESADVDPRLEAIVERMLNKCITDGKYQQAMGISIECRRLDKLKEAILSSDNVHATLAYCMNISHAFVNRREYRSEVDGPVGEKEKKAEPEPTFEILTNPARVVPAQEKYIKFLEDSRYAPVKAAASGFVLLKDLRPTEPEILSKSPPTVVIFAGVRRTNRRKLSSPSLENEMRKTPSLAGNRRTLEVNLTESYRKFITCIRKYILFYMKLLEETGDISTLERAYTAMRADKRVSQDSSLLDGGSVNNQQLCIDLRIDEFWQSSFEDANLSFSVEECVVLDLHMDHMVILE
ncbi:26S proteasome regulatory complex, non-ATPase subcomplex, Rpn2/Psmd1 subunit [Artemisia annua]|uniref:26S proteasome regulatory complex, non-ATPase subcomplex, Rpn2/Psmd1 subunit n=1 Tax=Artemisia annua TaxID=35608 RepID=A0A2U1LZU7_ARTAN|nr:26S proteasome regulatory complex, non-ATPase subcomplex, Rpn2/Psmd1 subunit [Artemisia annua]